MKSIALAWGVAAVLLPGSVTGQTDVSALEGAWRVTEMTTAGPGGGSVGAPQPGLLLFTGTYYSYTFVTGDEPRPVPPRGVATMEDLLNAWGPFTANAGTFEVSDTTMIRRPVVAKSPAAMGPGIFNAYTFHVSADTLWITTVGTETGVTRNPTTVRYVRVR